MTRPGPSSRSCAGTRRPRRSTSGASPGWEATPPTTPPYSSSTGPAGSGRTSPASVRCSGPCWTRCRSGAASSARAEPCSARSAARSPASNWGCCCRSCRPASSASTRPSPRPPANCPAGANGGGRLLLVAPNIVHVERELDVEPARLQALGVPARGDAPHPVHGRALAARPPGGRNPVVPRRDRGRPHDVPGAHQGGRAVPRRRQARRARRTTAGAPWWSWCRRRPSGRSSAG